MLVDLAKRVDWGLLDNQDLTLPSRCEWLSGASDGQVVLEYLLEQPWWLLRLDSLSARKKLPRAEFEIHSSAALQFCRC